MQFHFCFAPFPQEMPARVTKSRKNVLWGHADCVKCPSVLVATSSRLNLLGFLDLAKPHHILEALIRGYLHWVCCTWDFRVYL